MDEILAVSSVLLWVIVLLNMLLTLGLVRRLNSTAKRNDVPSDFGPKVGQKAPDFSAETLNGEVMTLSSFAGRAVVFIFVSPSCRPCREVMPSYIALGPRAARAGVELVLVCTADRNDTKAFAEEFQITLPMLIAPQESNSFTHDYNVMGTPVFCLIDADHIVRAAGYPSFDVGEWKALTTSWSADAR